jgi:hypothetical protein
MTVALHAVGTAIELEASYQLWRAQHERYLLLSRRAWLDGNALKESREVGPQSAPAELHHHRHHHSTADYLTKVKAEFALLGEVAAHAVEIIIGVLPGSRLDGGKILSSR